LRISEFCGLTINDLDMNNRIINIDHQLQRTSKMEYVIESTKTNAGTRKLPMTEDVYQAFIWLQGIAVFCSEIQKDARSCNALGA
jgi:integrase